MTNGAKTPDQYVDVILTTMVRLDDAARAGLRQHFLDCFDQEQLRQLAEGAALAANRLAEAISLLTANGELEQKPDRSCWIGTRDLHEVGPWIANETVETLLALGEVRIAATRVEDGTVAAVRRARRG